MEKFNVPGLFYFPTARGVVHIGRTIIAGCQTECGLPLTVGQDWVRTQPERGLCDNCIVRLRELAHPRGVWA
jgi:hypothetical protein